MSNYCLLHQNARKKLLSLHDEFAKQNYSLYMYIGHPNCFNTVCSVLEPKVGLFVQPYNTGTEKVYLGIATQYKDEVKKLPK